MIFALLLFVVLIVFIVLIVFGAKRTVTHLTEEERGDMVKQVYQYAVAFITLIMVIGGGVFAFMSIADYVSPSMYVESFEDYKNMRDYKSEDGTVQKELSETEWRAQYDAMVEQQIENGKQSALNSLIKSLGWIIIPLPIFILFQRRLHGRRKENR
ncbi:hypothetical protein [Halalkalibacter akibai]|uniref:DUF5671 domain-containing protein n=1 Tax=Halalkalibacter akibai (strain ATCC 43226 / DSM 21942 / CIP 109018 / JCM 9157 / 1139) TaxID=1236973 RepID=W4QT89_HALA3|nr:hypothetical protein [Halalkalibacter akibai]GAE34848.1 hypothetical protein JCM9157_1928 [Halalkalibacter akibai JCM 9157]